MGEEFWGKGTNIQEGPGINIARVMRNGRNFEYISGEDPVLGSVMVVPQILGIQKNVMSISKHYVMNNQEYLLRSIFMSTWGFWPAVFRPLRTVFPGLGAGFLNLGGKMGRTAKKRGKNEQKWARNGLKRVGAS